MAGHSHHEQHDHGSLNQLALSATLHCLSGCAAGEIVGMIIGTALDWGNLETVLISIVLAFAFGYTLTSIPLLKAGLSPRKVASLALASDTLSITTMEIVDNAFMVIVPGALTAGLGDPLFWISLVCAMVVAGSAAFPVNRWLLERGRGHAVVHAYH